MGRDTTDVRKMPTWKVVVAVLGALTALASAIVPAWLAYLDKSEERAQKSADEAAEQAQKSGEKAELAYELLRQQVTAMAAQMDRMQSKGDKRDEILVQIRVKLAEMGQERRYGSRGPASTRRGSGGSGDASDSLLDVLMGGDVGGEPLGMEGAAEPEPPVQQQLPVDLEKEWVKSKKGE